MSHSDQFKKNTKSESGVNVTKNPKFSPFQNDHQSLQVGQLVFENQTDKVILYGDIDIYKNEDGLQQAIKLRQVFDDIVAELERSRSESSANFYASNQTVVSVEKQNGKKVDNPFS